MPPDQRPALDRVPHDLQAEAAVLAACLLSGRALADARRSLTDPAPFWSPRHAQAWSAIEALSDRGDPVDPLTVSVELDAIGGRLDSVSLDWLVDLQAQAPGTANVGHYAAIVDGHARRRRVIELAATIGEEARTADSAESALSEARRRLDVLGHAMVAGSAIRVPDLAPIIDGSATMIEPTLLARTDGRRLLYPRAMHTFQAPPGTGKSWVALLAVKEVLAIGGTALYLDFEDAPASIVGRLRTLEVDPADILGSFVYARPEGPWHAPEQAHVADMLGRLNPDLVVLDGVATALAQNGLDENVAADVMGWIVTVPAPIALRGSAVLMLDHTKKDADRSERYARGSGAKLAAVDGAAYLLSTLHPYSRTRAGQIGMTITKDRHGAVGAVSETAGLVEMRPREAGAVLDAHVTPPQQTTDSEGHFRPAGLMATVCRLLADRPLREGTVVDRLPRSEPAEVRRAISALIREGNVTTVRDPDGSGSVLRVAMPFDPTSPVVAEGTF